MSILFILALTACRTNADPLDTAGLEGTGWDTGPDDLDEDGFGADLDCDDTDPEVNPAAAETCDAIDNDCDGLIDEELLVERFLDSDQDGYGSNELEMVCPDALGYADQEGDCDDAEALAHPGLEEVCSDGIDNDCDGGSNDCAPAGNMDTTSAVYGLLGNQEEDLLGLDVFGSEDLDGDGLGDVLVGSLKGGRDVPESGAAFLLRTQPSGVNEVSSVVDAQVTSDLERDFLGYCVRGGVDLNDDAQLDWVACAPGDVNRDTAMANEDRGEVFVFSGDLSGTVDAREGALIRLVGHEPGLHFGTTAALSNAGGPTLAVGARAESLIADGAGAVYLFTSPLDAQVSSSDADAVIRHSLEGERFGTAVALVDLNGDGIADLMAAGQGGAWPEDEERGTVAWFNGPLLGAYQIEDAEGRVVGAPESLVGQDFSTGDMNGDGYLDLAASHYMDGATGAYIFTGPIQGDLLISEAPAFIGEESTSNKAGSSLDMGRDMDGDGNADLLLGAWGTPEGENHGRAYLFMGPFEGESSLDGARASWGHTESEAAFGSPVRFAPDSDGDGTPEVLIGAPYTADGALYGGAAWLFAGSGL
ncbi:MAG: hypothetical protein ACI9VR_001529 [Cognaticolwellia sp.]|jgi:hypothetical protein